MRYKVSQILWLLPLLVFLIRSDVDAAPDLSTKYDRQVIALLDDNPTIHKAGHYLYEKHDTTSDVVKWNENDQKFERVEWNEQREIYETSQSQDPLPITTEMWPKTRIQVVGHGDINPKTRSTGTTTISKLSANKLAEILFKNLGAGDVGRISIVGCTRPAERGSVPEEPKYLRQMLSEMRKSYLKRTKTEVSIRSALVSVDRTGRKLTGELVLSGKHNSEVGIEWSHKNPSNKWIGKLTEGKEIDIKNVDARASSGDNAMKSHFYGILPEDSKLYVSTYKNDEAAATPSIQKTYEIDDTGAFDWVDRIAENTYTNIPQGRASEVSQQVQLLTGQQTVENLNVKEINSMDDLLKEIHHYGETGPATQQTKTEYYRFGDWVVSINPKDFYASVEGVIMHPDDSAEKTAKVTEFKNLWKTYAYGILPEEYPIMQPNTGDNFFQEVNKWINGQHQTIGLDIESAYNAQCGMAMFMSESIRSFQNHITNMMSLDLIHNGYLNKEYFFETHPMARKSTWQIVDKTGPQKVKKTGLAMLRDRDAKRDKYRVSDPDTQQAFDETVSRISRISKSWLSHVKSDEFEGSRHEPPETTPEKYSGQSILSSIEDIGSIAPYSKKYLREYELIKATDRLLSTTLTEPEIESVNTQIKDFSTTEDISSPLRASMAMANDHAYISGLIDRQVQLKEQQTGKKYEVLPDSLILGQNDDSVRFRVREKGTPSSATEELSTVIDKTKLASKALVEDLQTKANELQQPSGPESKVSKINQGLAIYGVVRGLAGSITAFENGNVTQGAIGLAQSLHGIGELSGFNKAVYKAAGKYLGNVLRNQVDSVSESVSTIAGEDAGNLVKSAGGEILSTVGEVGDFLEDVPVIGTAFGVYNIYEDFQQHSTLGYIDAGLDIAITGLSLLGPEAEPVVLALTIIRMGIDTFYNDISKELKALPPNASVSQKIGAVFKGIGQAFVDLFEEFTLPGQIFGAISNSHKLDKQYEKDRSFLNKLSNYQNYFTVVKEEGSGASEINFAGGSVSWNGGDITFHLGESGQSTLALEAVDSSGSLRHETHTIYTQGVEDIIMGIGESHSISFKKQTVKFLWFIPVHSRTLISDSSGERQTLHGTYYGNSQGNKFIAVQQLPPQGASLGYNLHDYHYKLYGRGGDDTFYLGPQHSYVEGNDGSDTYFVNTISVYTEINNYANDGEVDTLILILDYASLTPRREGLNLYITTSGNTHTILIDNWFHDDTYQHMVFKTRDGVLFKVSATGTGQVDFIPYALSGAMATEPQVLDAREHGMLQVMTFIGSSYDDVIYGNNMDNHINGGKGSDTLTGGEGKDTYTIDLNEGIDTINNYATDGKIDILLLAARLDDIVSFSRQSTNDLYLTRRGSTGNQLTGAVIKNWFLHDNYRHLILVSEDGVVLNISSTKDERVKLQPIMVDMSLIQLGSTTQQFVIGGIIGVDGHPLNPGPSYTAPHRRIDLSSDPLLTDVVTIIGSAENDFMIGNHKDNYMSGGKGSDTMEGKEGSDVYVIKEGDGSIIIKNIARDDSMDTLLMGANYDDIVLSSSFGDLVLTAHRFLPEKMMIVTVEDWFSGGAAYQHMMVRSADGVVFELPTSEWDLVKTAKIIDNTKLSTNVYINLNGKWSQVERVLGSKGDDKITGNSLTNYMDPGSGRCHLRGNGGSDTYIIRSNGKGNVIDNYADDNRPDSILFNVPFFSIDAKIRGTDIQMTSITGKGHVNTRLKHYTSQSKYRHLTVITEDGFTFVLPIANNYKPVPIVINRVKTTTGQHIDLTSNSSFSEVRTVYGSKSYQNSIIGNQQNNTVIGGSEADTLQGLGGDDVLKGGAGNDIIQGGPGADTLVGGDGNDRLDGGADDDIISPGLGTNQINGGEGIDTVIYSGEVLMEKGIHLNLRTKTCIHEGNTEDTLNSIENAYGTEYDDVLQGDDEDNVLVGQGGDDHLTPGSGYDVLDGGNGNDTYDLASANGTVTLRNYATDRAWDKVIMTYAKMSHLRYEKVGNDLIVRVINIQHPVFYDINKPTVIFKGWFIDNRWYHHAYIDAADGRIESKFLKRHAREAAERAAIVG